VKALPRLALWLLPLPDWAYYFSAHPDRNGGHQTAAQRGLEVFAMGVETGLADLVKEAKEIRDAIGTARRCQAEAPGRDRKICQPVILQDAAARRVRRQ
jgi:hypothetical protein